MSVDKARTPLPRFAVWICRIVVSRTNPQQIEITEFGPRLHCRNRDARPVRRQTYAYIQLYGIRKKVKVKFSHTR